MVPHLITALTGPINELEQRILESMPAIERWFRLEWMEHTPPFYTSVDVRNAGIELVLEPLLRTRGRLGLKDFDPCTILLNNDLSGGIPKVLENLHEQYVLP